MNQSSVFTTLLRFFSSLRLAAVLIAVLIIVAIVGSFLPQVNLFASIWFLLPLGFFAVNLSVCAIRRLIRQLEEPGVAPLASASPDIKIPSSAPKFKRSWTRFGPDILHLGLLLLIIAGFVSAATRIDFQMLIAPGETRDFPGGHKIELLELRSVLPVAARTREWTGLLRLDGAPAVELRVNNPAQIAGLGLYQSGIQQIQIAKLKDTQGTLWTVRAGEGLRLVRDQGQRFLAFRSITANLAIFELDGKEFSAQLGQVLPGIPSLTLEQFSLVDFLVLKVSGDPAIPLVWLAFLLIFTGMSISLGPRLATIVRQSVHEGQ